MLSSPTSARPLRMCKISTAPGPLAHWQRGGHEPCQPRTGTWPYPSATGDAALLQPKSAKARENARPGSDQPGPQTLRKQRRAVSSITWGTSQ
ncbi:hypothetical protein NDU88_002860 [Pleurodeles waltl]|uniref:Uncharacterized protein n=1 Tax=Pleurodeles waltl TaxID=8319 RepID=A0AAV7QD16_PLEWA|nr:hypothetical protein NDU88_002860 [Pleurodeles waltl]